MMEREWGGVRGSVRVMNGSVIGWCEEIGH